MKTVVIAAFVSALPALAAAQYKCTAPDGKVGYQQTPCAGLAREERVRISTAQETDYAGAARAATYERRELARLEWRSAMNTAVGLGVPVVGMSATELRSALGAPSRVNLSDYGRGLEAQQVYERPGLTWIVYVKDGAVTAMQMR